MNFVRAYCEFYNTMVEISFMDTNQIPGAGSRSDPPIATATKASSKPEKMSVGSRRALIAAVSGTLIEWYDYALYGAASGLVIAPLFFADERRVGKIFPS